MSYYGSYTTGNRQLEIMKCLNKWATINFTDGTKVQAYLTSLDLFGSTAGYLTRGSYRSVTCQGAPIMTAQQAQGCMNRMVQVTLPNGVNLTMTMTYFDDKYIGGTFQTSQLIALSNQISAIQC